MAFELDDQDMCIYHLIYSGCIDYVSLVTMVEIFYLQVGQSSKNLNFYEAEFPQYHPIGPYFDVNDLHN